MSLVELIALADERGLAASGLACLDRCVPLLGGDDDDVLRPLWTSLVDGEAWGERVEKARADLGEPGDSDADVGSTSGASPDDQAAFLVRRMLATVPLDSSSMSSGRGPMPVPWRPCGYELLDIAADGTSSVEARREGRTDGMSPLVAAELRRQIAILELLADRGAGGLRLVLGQSTEGRRVLRAVVSRRARGRA